IEPAGAPQLEEERIECVDIEVESELRIGGWRGAIAGPHARRQYGAEARYTPRFARHTGREPRTTNPPPNPRARAHHDRRRPPTVAAIGDVGRCIAIGELEQLMTWQLERRWRRERGDEHVVDLFARDPRCDRIHTELVAHPVQHGVVEVEIRERGDPELQ